MAGNRLTIFDTTLRDGEQAPGFSLRIDEKLALARQFARWAWTSSRPGFPIASRGRRRGGPAWSRRTSAARSIAALARCRAAGHRARRLGARRRRRARRIHIFIATSDLHLERKLRMTRDECLDAAVERGPAARGNHTDDVEFSAEDATRSDPRLPVPSRRSGDPGRARRRSTCPTRSATRRRTRSASSSRAIIARVPNSDQVDLQRALPRRPRAGGGQQPRRDSAAARGRSSARSTASASAPATRRSKRS